MTSLSGFLLIYAIRGDFIMKRLVSVLLALLALAVTGGSTITWIW